MAQSAPHGPGLARQIPSLAARLYGWLTTRLYHEFAWAYELVAWLVSLGRWSAWRRSVLRYVAGRRVLELGCGTGALLLEMSRCGLDAVGLDLSPAMLRLAARRARRSTGNIALVRADGRALPFSDGSFDSVVATFPAGYILDSTTLQEVARILRRSPTADGHAPTLVVVGLTVETRCRALAWLASLVNGGWSEKINDCFLSAAAFAGLAGECILLNERLFQVPVLVLTPVTGNERGGGE